MGLLAPEVYQAQPNSVAVYVRHRPETTLLYQVIREYWPEFQAELASQNKYLPAYVVQEFEAYLKCGILEHGFLRVQCETCRFGTRDFELIYRRVCDTLEKAMNEHDEMRNHILGSYQI